MTHLLRTALCYLLHLGHTWYACTWTNGHDAACQAAFKVNRRAWYCPRCGTVKLQHRRWLPDDYS